MTDVEISISRRFEFSVGGNSCMRLLFRYLHGIQEFLFHCMVFTIETVTIIDRVIIR